jgi:hypothetical protein
MDSIEDFLKKYPAPTEVAAEESPPENEGLKGFMEKWKTSGTKVPEGNAAKILGEAAKDTASNAESVARGALSVIPGQFGDMEELGRKGVNTLANMTEKAKQNKYSKPTRVISEEPVLNTTEDFLKKYPQRFTEPTPQTTGMEMLGAAGNLGGMERGIRTVAELPGNVMRAGKDFAVAAGETGKSKLLTSPTAEEKAAFEAAEKKGEDTWGSMKMFRDPKGTIFKRTDDSKAEWKGMDALHAKVPKRKADLDAKEAARDAHREQVPRDGTFEDYNKWQEEHDALAEGANAARNLLYSKHSTKGLKLGDVLKHDDLFAEHPDMADINVTIGTPAEMKGAYAHYHGPTRTITLSGQTWRDLVRGMPTEDKALTAVLHEAQHDIDNSRRLGGETNLDWGSSVGEVQGARKGKNKVDEKTAFKLYQANPGEVRARYAEEGYRIPNDQAPHPMELGQKGTFDLHPASWVPESELGTRPAATVGKTRPKLSAPEPMATMEEALGKEGTTLKSLETLPMSKGVVNVSTVRDALNRVGASKPEREALESFLPDEGTIKASDLVEQFRAATKDFELTPHHHKEYADYGLDVLRDRMPKGARTTTWRVGDGVSGSTGNHFSDPQYFAHTRAFEEDGVPHVVEMQSDLMQRKTKPLSADERKSLEEGSASIERQRKILAGHDRRAFSNTTEDYLNTLKALEKENPDAATSMFPMVEDGDDSWATLDHHRKNIADHDRVGVGANDETAANSRNSSEVLDRAFYTLDRQLALRARENKNRLNEAGATKDLTPMKKTHVERLVKEELNLARKNGQERVRFASPDTVAKVEGWPDAGGLHDYILRDKQDLKLLESELEKEKEWSRNNPSAIPKGANSAEVWEAKITFRKNHLRDLEEELEEFKGKTYKPEHQGIYDNYKEIEKYLKKIGGTEYTDPHGHTWIEVPSTGPKSPVKDGRVPLFSMTGAPLAGGAGAGYNANQPERK